MEREIKNKQKINECNLPCGKIDEYKTDMSSGERDSDRQQQLLRCMNFASISIPIKLDLEKKMYCDFNCTLSLCLSPPLWPCHSYHNYYCCTSLRRCQSFTLSF